MTPSVLHPQLGEFFPHFVSASPFTVYKSSYTADCFESPRGVHHFTSIRRSGWHHYLYLATIVQPCCILSPPVKLIGIPTLGGGNWSLSFENTIFDGTQLISASVSREIFLVMNKLWECAILQFWESGQSDKWSAVIGLVSESVLSFGSL